MLLKSYLKTSKFDLFDVWRIIKYAIENQLVELQSIQARQQTRRPTEYIGGGLFSVLYGWLSYEAMKKVEEQQKLLERPTPILSPRCTGAFTKLYGLPCAYKIKSLQDSNRCLQLDDFHQQ